MLIKNKGADQTVDAQAGLYLVVCMQDIFLRRGPYDIVEQKRSVNATDHVYHSNMNIKLKEVQRSAIL